jgi:hypothetical protein
VDLRCVLEASLAEKRRPRVPAGSMMACWWFEEPEGDDKEELRVVDLREPGGVSIFLFWRYQRYYSGE